MPMRPSADEWVNGALRAGSKCKGNRNAKQQAVEKRFFVHVAFFL
jgi:hypothetical protein